jgi:CheY-like chemotaxis protein
MSKEVKERVLEPFFTTKEQGKGTGLGLSMVYGFVQRSGGQLKIYSEEGKGTTIRLYLPPATSKSSTSRAPITADEDLPCGNETVLVVEDEPALLEVAVAFLKSLGYKTHQAVDGGMAIELLEGKAKIDLLFSDVIIPGKMDGYQLAQAVRQTYPDLKILLASGFTKKRETTAHENKQLVADLTANLLSKPYNKAELAHAVRRILDR